ncbi:transcriptional regulator Kaiso [Stegastes partitus]|uniref:Transcriptional regulator Kaiso n=2 Tax=Stegastes partitus TaxID=144197 RepID=A0A9Y4JFQ4_9TELE|nr:PREDICTED: transcriptional regulator Kaiso [Stegastes partitus]
MPRYKSYRRSQAAKRRVETQRALNIELEQTGIASHACRGTGYRHAVRKWPTSSVTGQSHKVVIPAESPDKKFVLLVGDSHLRSVADGFVEMPEGDLSFGVMATPKAAAAELRMEVMNAVLPRTPDAVCLLAPSNNLTASKTIDEAAADFGNLLVSLCNLHDNVAVLDFPPRLNVDIDLQQHLHQAFHFVAAHMGVKYFSTVECFPMTNLELWSRDGVHLSDTVGMPILTQLLWFASYMILQPPAPELQFPPRSPQRRSLQRLVVKEEVTELHPPVNPFEWTPVRRGQKRHQPEELQQSSGLACKRSLLQQQVEEAPSGVQVCSWRSPSRAATVSVKQEVDMVSIGVNTSSRPLSARAVNEELDATPSTVDMPIQNMPSLKLISATDTQYSATVLKSMNEQRSHGLFCDVTIIIQDKKFRAHKTILSASSTYFHQLFSVAGQVIELNFIRPQVFEQILNYIYSSKIIRVRSDMLEELISAGQILGVKFIANLASPLSEVKGLPGLSKDTESKSDTATEMMPIITESFSISAEEFNQTNKPAGSDDDSDSDVMFVSHTDAEPKATDQKATDQKATDQKTTDQKATDQKATDQKATDQKATDQKTTDQKGTDQKGTDQKGTDQKATDQKATDQKASSGEVPDVDKAQSENVKSNQNVESSDAAAKPEEKAPTTLTTHAAKPPSTGCPQPTLPDSSPLRSPDSSSNNSSSPARVSSASALTTPATLSSFPPEPSSVSQSSENSDIMGVHKKQVSASSQQGDFKIRLLDVSQSSSVQSNIPKPAIAAKKTVTLNTATEIDSISSGCKVYANIGENTYDIVPVKEDPGEGGSKASNGKRSLMATPLKPLDKTPVSPKAGPNKKRTKTELEDHYELIMDGKTFYVCIVCKRPYVCLPSLRRHFNTHSWEKKYPCRYCNKVFALAEYRTKHEIHHTGERRYQCLLCNEMFINYQLLSAHCKQVHNQDPSGRKEKDDGDNNLYRLLPCKTVQMKSYSWLTDGPGVPVISEDGSVHHITSVGEAVHSSTQTRMLNWDDIFVKPEADMAPDSRSQPESTMNTPPQGATEFGFVRPETY